MVSIDLHKPTNHCIHILHLCNLGFQLMMKNHELIVEKIALDPKAVAVALQAEGFVSQETVSEVIELVATKQGNALKLFTLAVKEVQLYPHKYKTFMAIIEKTHKRQNSKFLGCVFIIHFTQCLIFDRKYTPSLLCCC